MSADIVPFKRKTPKLKPDENELIVPTKEQLASFITTLEYLVDLNGSDSVSINIESDGELTLTVISMQDFSEANSVISGSNLELAATGNLVFGDIPESIAVLGELIKRVSLDNYPDDEKKK